MIFIACLLYKSATFLQLFDTLICATDFENLANQWYKIDTEIFFRTVHLRTVIEWSTELRYGIFLEVRITEHHTVTYRSKPLESNDQSVPLHFTWHMTMAFFYIA